MVKNPQFGERFTCSDLGGENVMEDNIWMRHTEECFLTQDKKSSANLYLRYPYNIPRWLQAYAKVSLWCREDFLTRDRHPAPSPQARSNRRSSRRRRARSRWGSGQTRPWPSAKTHKTGTEALMTVAFVFTGKIKTNPEINGADNLWSWLLDDRGDKKNKRP